MASLSVSPPAGERDGQPRPSIAWALHGAPDPAERKVPAAATAEPWRILALAWSSLTLEAVCVMCILKRLPSTDSPAFRGQPCLLADMCQEGRSDGAWERVQFETRLYYLIYT